MLLTDEEIENMEVTKWNELEGLKTQEEIIALLSDAFDTPEDKNYIRYAIAVAMEAIKVYDIKMATDEEAASLAEDAAAIKSGIPHKSERLFKKTGVAPTDGAITCASDVREIA